MSENTTDSIDKSKVEKVQPIPENLPEELLPLYDWWKAKGPQSIISISAVALIGFGAFAFIRYKKSKAAEANIEMRQAVSVDDLEAVVAKYGNLKPGNTTRLRLAKAYYDASKYKEALEAYDACTSKGVSKEFADLILLGRAHALEALEKNEEALQIFKDFSENHKESYLYPQAKMGLARVLTRQGNKDEAKKLLEELKAEKTDDPMWEMTIANLEDVVERYEPRSKRSLFDMADEAGRTLNSKLEPTTSVNQ